MLIKLTVRRAAKRRWLRRIATTAMLLLLALLTYLAWEIYPMLDY
jgi:hypothetical protein